jgi:hypothetical protein
MHTSSSPTQFARLSEAKRFAKQQRALGLLVKILRHETVHTQPGKGIAVATHYTVAVAQ